MRVYEQEGLSANTVNNRVWAARLDRREAPRVMIAAGPVVVIKANVSPLSSLVCAPKLRKGGEDNGREVGEREGGTRC
jgi:hypothetical protein